MTRKEMILRLESLELLQIDRINDLINQGWGAHSIKIETGCTLKQVNAVFELNAKWASVHSAKNQVGWMRQR